MGACCSAGARDRHDKTIMPAPQHQEQAPRSGLSKLQTLRYQVRTRTAPKHLLLANTQTTDNEVPLLPNDNQRDENSNSDSPASTARSDGNANVTSSMHRFGFGLKKANQNKLNDKTHVDRTSRDSGKGSADSVDVKTRQTSAICGRITPSNSTGSLSVKSSGDRKPLVASHTTNIISRSCSSSKSSTSSLSSQGSRPASPSLVKSKSQPLKTPCFKTTGISKPSVQQPRVTVTRPKTPTRSVTSTTTTKSAATATIQEEVGYRSSRLPMHARGPYLSRLQSQATKAEPYTTSLTRSHTYQKTDQAGKLQQATDLAKPAESKLGYRTTAVPNQLSFSQRKSFDVSKNTPDSMTESIFNADAPLATFDSLGSTSFMSQISMGSDDMILDFTDESETTPGYGSVASTPGDDKNIEREFLTSSLGRKARSKSIDAPRKSKNLAKSPLVIDTTNKDDSAYVSGSNDNLDSTLVNSTYSCHTGALSPVLDVSTDTASLEDVDKTLSSSSLDYKSPARQQQGNNRYDADGVAEEDASAIMSETFVLESILDLESEPTKETKQEGPELRMRYRSRPRAATLQELTELIHETSPGKDPVQRTRSLSSPLKPPRPRSMSGVEEEEHVVLEAHDYRQTMQEITNLKTMLHKLKRCLHEEDASLLELAENRRGLRSSSFGSEGSLLDECPLRRKSSQRYIAEPSTGNKSAEISPRDRVGSLIDVDLAEENYQLRQQLAALRRDVEEKDHTIHLLQQQMTKYETEDKSRSYQTSFTQTEPPSNDRVRVTVSEPPRTKLVKQSGLPQSKQLQQRKQQRQRYPGRNLSKVQ